MHNLFIPGAGGKDVMEGFDREKITLRVKEVGFAMRLESRV